MALAQVDNGLKASEGAYAERMHRWQNAAIVHIAKRLVIEGDGVLRSGLNLFGSVPELRSDPAG